MRPPQEVQLLPISAQVKGYKLLVVSWCELCMLFSGTLDLCLWSQGFAEAITLTVTIL